MLEARTEMDEIHACLPGVQSQDHRGEGSKHSHRVTQQESRRHASTVESGRALLAVVGAWVNLTVEVDGI